MPEAKIVVEQLYKIFGPAPAEALARVKAGISKRSLLTEHGHVLGLADINLNIADQEIFVCMGLSGSGKSTLIRHFNRLIEPTEGAISIDGRDVLGLSRHDLEAFRRQKMSMVFQRFGLFPHWRCGTSARRTFTTGPCSGSSRWVWRGSKTTTRGSSPAACSNASAWRAPWRPTPKFSSWTRPSAPSTRSSAPACRTCCWNSRRS